MSKAGAKLLCFLNKFTRKREHPFNMRNDGVKTYADWLFEKAGDTISLYQPRFTPQEMFADKMVLDCGCGEAGKTVYYATFGAKKVVGVDIFPDYQDRAEAFAEKKGVADRFEFLVASATELPFADNSFDTIIMNDFIEHVSSPEEALREALRVLRPGGRLYTNFPPYNHPLGAHLFDAIRIPWVHVFFSEDSTIRAYKELVKDLPDCEERIRLRFSEDENGQSHITYINKMSIRWFEEILQSMKLQPLFYNLTPLRSYVRHLAAMKLFREYFTRMVTCVLEKPQQTEAELKS